MERYEVGKRNWNGRRVVKDNKTVEIEVKENGTLCSW